MAEAANNAVSLKFPQGVNNRDREYALPDGTLREAINLDVTRDGGLRSRLGLRTVMDGNCHSLWVHPNEQFALLVRNQQLVRLSRAETVTVLNSVVGSHVSYALLNDAVFWTDGGQVGQVKADGTVGRWGLANPPLPLCEAASSGGLFAGTYQVAMTALHSSGLESGASETVLVEVTAGGGIQVTAPSTSDSEIRFAVYRTEAEGGQESLRRAVVVAPGATVILGVQTLGQVLETLGVVAPLPGQALIAHKGRLWCASGAVLWFTTERSPHGVRRDQGYYQFESAVQMLSATEDGIFVGLYDRVYYLQGNQPGAMTQRAVSSVGVAFGSAGALPYDLFLGEGAFPSKQGLWMDTDGFLCIGKAGGIVVRPTKSRYSAGEIRQGSVIHRVRDGLSQIIGVFPGTQDLPWQSVDCGVAAVFSHGVVLDVAP